MRMCSICGGQLMVIVLFYPLQTSMLTVIHRSRIGWSLGWPRRDSMLKSCFGSWHLEDPPPVSDQQLLEIWEHCISLPLDDEPAQSNTSEEQVVRSLLIPPSMCFLTCVPFSIDVVIDFSKLFEFIGPPQSAAFIHFVFLWKFYSSLWLLVCCVQRFFHCASLLPFWKSRWMKGRAHNVSI